MYICKFIINLKFIQSIIHNYSIHKKLLTNVPKIWREKLEIL